jgi:drug/metabolite transporter (DMT)-like permease
MKRKTVVFVVIALLSLSIAIPAVAFAQDFLSRPDLLPPVAMMAFGFVGLVGGTIGYFWRQRKQ